MALRLGEYVVYGELRNTSPYSLHGTIVLRADGPDGQSILHLDLTGDCDPDLRGRHFRFHPGEDDENSAVFRQQSYPGFQLSQIGPTSTMTAQGWARTLPCGVEEFIQRAELGEPPPTSWKRRLYLEWYGQNGRVLVELAGPIVEECVREPETEDDDGDWEPLENLALPPELDDSASTEGPEIVVIENEGAGAGTWAQAGTDDDIHESDPARSAEESREAPDVIREMELMDECLEFGQQRSVEDLLGGIEDFVPADELDDAEVEASLKSLLARLALLGIALDVCEHYTPRKCYQLLRNRILREPVAYAELAGTGWVQHVMTHEYCRECDPEIEFDEFECDNAS